MINYEERSITVYDLPFTKGVKVLHPESVVVRFGESGTVDIGALCYLIRSKKQRHNSRAARRVNPESFNKARTEQIRKLIEYVSDMTANGSRRPSSVQSELRKWIRFIDWCDVSEYSEILENKCTAREAFRAYIGYLTEKIQHDILSCNTAQLYQSSSLILLHDFLGLDDVEVGIKLIHKSSNANEPTLVPSEEDQNRVLSLCECIFKGLSKLVIENQLYPFRMSMPEYLDWDDNCLWVFPVHRWSMSPHLLSVREEISLPYWAYDYTHGCITSIDEIAHRYVNKYQALRFIKNAEQNIANANSNMRHHRRIQSAMLAHNAFVLLFIANTGMNWAQVADLRWSKNYELSVESQGFREIKYRAANKTVSFRIEISFLPMFCRFLELRKYLLDDKTHTDFLFFSLGSNRCFSPKKMYWEILFHLFETLRNIDPDIPKVMSRAWRVAKSDWLIRNTDLSTTALILQNSENTVAHAYATGSESRAVEELGQFFERISHRVRDPAKDNLTDNNDNAVGKCTDYGNPNAEKGAPIQPNCQQAEGCLFCDKFAVHSDERDVRKLAICRYCISQTSHLSVSKEHFESMYGSVIQRIEQLLEYISDLSKDYRAMVQRVQKEVEEDGELDPYWSGKLDMLIHLGVVSA